jgi:hypothetical protein
MQAWTVRFERTTATIGSYATGFVKWTGDKGHVVRMPVAIRPILFAAPSEVTVPAAGGSFQVMAGYTGSLSATASGLVPATETADTIPPDPTPTVFTPGETGTKSYDVVVPAGTTYFRSQTFDDGDSDDMDLYVYRLNPDSTLGPQVGSSGGATTAEQVNISNPTAATYRVFVHAFGTDGPTGDYTLHAWVSGPSVGNMTVSAPASVTIGDTPTVTLGFNGLTAGRKYLGLVIFGNPGELGRTVVRVNP